ncbi:RNase H domain-containing protein [Trichonephila clavipes]|nr:RNase H domain-containing protein [Trichonephila clavipes]
MDSTGLDILSKLVKLRQRKQVCLQWIPSHVGVPGNETADELAGRGCDLPNPSSTAHTEIPSFQRKKIYLTWRNPPAHHWYAAKSPGQSIQCRSSRAHQTALARFRSGHLHSKGCFFERTATAGSDVVQSGRPIFDDFFQHLWPYIGNNTANVVFQMVKRLCLICIDQ